MRKLLYAGAVAPILFVIVFLVEGLTRPGYSAWRNFVSQLATGPGGWVQTANFLVYGTLMLLFAAGLRWSLGSGRASVAAPVLFGVYGLGLITAGLFATDPALGYPVGAAHAQTTHGLIHGVAGLVVFGVLAVASFVMAWRFASDGSGRRWTIYSTAVGLVIVASFIVSSAVSTMDELGTWPNAPTGLVQRIAIIAGWTWIAMVAWHQLRAPGALLARRRPGSAAQARVLAR